ncbi:serine-threonine protein kinase, plant-type, putative [Ricinus communis]|uniref:Serine-threonine protein kinase, plant-type, putative n=1 Tax=Ricinus communis TaxID=3988 RepID=B9S299_RICCO|nr:serine-threonine protein kinase, plant-type, putative [Ricinus communis]
MVVLQLLSKVLEEIEHKATTSGWSNEMRFLSRLNHPNIVKLLGYCCEQNDTELDWWRRVGIALEAARGLAYLHTRRKPVMHRDLKASNVLLGTDFSAKLSDFGLAKSGPQGEESHVTTRVLGTRGYFAPEYVATGRLTLKADVFRFGVVLLEILSGCAVKKHSDGLPGSFAQWAKPHLSNKLELHHVIDKKLRSIPMEEARDFAAIILRCLSSNPKTRPTMTEVVADLELLQQSMDSHNAADLQYLRTRR